MSVIYGWLTGRRTLYLFLLVVVFIFLYLSAGDIEWFLTNWQDNLQRLISEAGVYSFLVYFLLTTFVILTPVASSTLWLIAGYLFHPVVAILLTLLAEVVGVTGNYYIGKWFIGGWLARGRLPKVAAFIDSQQGRLTPRMIFTLGLIPVSTTNITAYASALTGVSLLRHLLPWMLGVTISIVLTVLLGRSALQHSLLQALGIAALALVIGYGVRHFIMKRRKTLGA